MACFKFACLSPILLPKAIKAVACDDEWLPSKYLMANALAPKVFLVPALFLGQEDRPQRYVLPVCRLPFQSSPQLFPETKSSTADTVLRNGQRLFKSKSVAALVIS